MTDSESEARPAQARVAQIPRAERRGSASCCERDIRFGPGVRPDSDTSKVPARSGDCGPGPDLPPGIISLACPLALEPEAPATEPPCQSALQGVTAALGPESAEPRTQSPSPGRVIVPARPESRRSLRRRGPAAPGGSAPSLSRLARPAAAQ